MILLDFSSNHSELGRGQRMTLRITAGEHHDFSRSASGENNIGRTTDHQQKFPMFIDTIHFVNDGEQVITSVSSIVERLEIADHISDLRVGNALYVSLNTGEFVFRGRNGCDDGKCDVIGFGSSLCTRKNPDEMVKTGAQVVNDLSDQNTKSQGDIETSVIVNCILPRLIVWLWDGGVFAIPKEPFDFGFQVDDVLVGPF